MMQPKRTKFRKAHKGRIHGAATEGREACNRSTWTHWITPLTVDAGTLLHSADPSHIVQQSFHPNAAGHAQLGRCLTEFYADGLAEGSCLRGADGNLHATTAVTTATARGTAQLAR